jgi:xanthine/CO dehydrogenase XdhC/CoxF family maturation factor
MSLYEQALNVLAATPTVLPAIVAATPEEVLTREPAPGAWSPLRTLGHMLYVENVIIAPRVRLMLEQDDPVYPPGPRESEDRGPDAILADWLAARERHLALLRTLTPDQRQRAGRHHRYGRITVEEHVIEWAYHDLDHLRQLLAALQVQLHPGIGAFKAIYPLPQF